MTTPRDDIAGLSEEPGRVDRALSLQLLKERDELQSLAKELSDALLAVRPLGGSELFVRRFGQHYADPVYCKAAIEQGHKDRHEAQKGLIRYRRQAEKAEQERDALQARVNELESELSRCGRENCFGHKVDGCANWVREERLDEANARATCLHQERDEAYERAARTAHTWSIASNIRLHAGEMSAQEMRTAQAIACGIEAAIRRLAGPEKA